MQPTEPMLIYEDTGEPVAVGDIVRLDPMQPGSTPEYARVTYIWPLHSPASSGKVNVFLLDDGPEATYYVGIIGAKWINRTDR